VIITAKRIVCSLFLISSLFILFSTKSALAYTMADVDNFISSVQSTLSIGDKINKIQFQRDGQTGYRVYLENDVTKQKFIGWQVVSEGPCSDGWPTYWENRIVTQALVELTYSNGTVEKNLDTKYSAEATRSFCVLFDEQEAFSGRFGVCFGVGSILHNIHYVCAPGSSYYDETISKVPLVPPAPTDQTLTPAPPTLLQEFFPVDNQCSLAIGSFTATSNTINATSGGNLAINGTITDSSGQSITWTLSTPDGKTTTGSGTSVSATWDGKDASGKNVKPGIYSAKLTAQTADGLCTDSKTANITLFPSPLPEDPCSQNAPAQSTVQMSTGSLKHDQDLFTLPSAPLLQGITLYYGTSSYAGPLGPNWSLNHDIGLTVSGDGVVGIRTAVDDYRMFTPTGNGDYTSQTGDSSVLTLSANGYLLTLKNGAVYQFDVDDTLKSVTDAFGNVLYYTYDNGDLTSVSDQSGRSITIHYDTSVMPHRIDSIKDPRQISYGFTYVDNNPNSRLKRVVLPAVDGGTQPYWEYDYYATGDLKTKRDPAGNLVQYEYDGNGKLSKAIDPDGVIDPSGHSRSYVFPTPAEGATTVINTFIEKDSGQWFYNVDLATGLVTSKQGPDGKVFSYIYNADYRLKAKTEPGLSGKLISTFYTYDAIGNTKTVSIPVEGIDPASVTDPTTDSRTPTAFSYTYELSNALFLNRVKSIEDRRNPANILTTSINYSIDTDGTLLTTVTDPTSAVSTIRQFPNGKLKEVIDANQFGKSTTLKTTFIYRPSDGLLESVTGPDGVSIWFTQYDANGNNTERQIKDADGILRQTISMVYDARNRLKTSTVIASGQPDIVTTYGYDANDNLTSVIDPEQQNTSYKTMYEYTYNGQIKKITDANNKITTLDYGTSGCTSCGGSGGVDKLKMVEDANHHQTTFDYDQLGRLTLEKDPENKKILYTYYDNGLVKEKYDATTTPARLLITYSYNNDRQLTKKVYTDGTPDTVYAYDANGRLQTASNANISYTLAYHDNSGSYNGRLKSITDNSDRQIFYDQYNKQGQRQKVTILKGAGVDQRTLDYTYTDANRPWTITANSAKTFTYAYDKLGRRDTITYPNGITAKHGYDNLNRLTSIKHSTSPTATITFANYSGFDKSGNRKNKITPSGTECYTYDNIYRLKQADTPNGSEKFIYDDVGNRQSGPGPKDTAFAYDTANRMTHGRQFAYDYDNAGNQTTRTITSASDKGWTLTWDLDNRLKQLDKARRDGNGVVIESRSIAFKYDPFGRRIEKKLTTFIDNISNTKITKWTYVYDGDNIALEIYEPPSGPAEKTYYIHGPSVDEHLGMERGGSYYYYHADGLGSITAITDSSAAVVQSYTYDSFGMMKPSTSFRNSFTYTGREWDKETGLYYLRYRYYDPMDGRFISKDPIGFKGGINLYGYVKNNPIKYIDPKGLAGVVAGFGGLPFFIPPGSVFDPGSHDNNVFVGSALNLLQLFDPRPLADLIYKKLRPDAKPNECPTGTKPIDQFPGLDKDQIHGIKDGVGAGPRDWTGISPDGDVITGDENGDAVNNGPYDSYLP
jgi:RHS repeat-associated protein